MFLPGSVTTRARWPGDIPMPVNPIPVSCLAAEAEASTTTQLYSHRPRERATLAIQPQPVQALHLTTTERLTAMMLRLFHKTIDYLQLQIAALVPVWLSSSSCWYYCLCSVAQAHYSTSTAVQIQQTTTPTP